MIVKVKLSDREYFSNVFFVCTYNYKEKFIVFDDVENKFKFIDTFESNESNECYRRLVYTYDYNEYNFVKKSEYELSSFVVEKCKGYEWIYDNLKNIEKGQQIDEKYINFAKEINSKIDIYRWHEINNEEDIEELLDISGGFHDSYIRDFKGIFGRPFEPEFITKFQLAFEIYGCHYDIMLEFEGGVDIKYGLSSNLNFIYSSTIMFCDGLIYWVDGGDDLSPIDIKDNPYISSKILRWKIIDKL